MIIIKKWKVRITIVIEQEKIQIIINAIDANHINYYIICNKQSRENGKQCIMAKPMKKIKIKKIVNT